jgi:hypothetical protein
MRVLYTYFLDQFPNMPVFEMTDRTIRLPFISPQTGGTFYMTEKQMTEGESDVKKLETLRAPFSLARAAIIEVRSKEMIEASKPKGKKIITVN